MWIHEILWGSKGKKWLQFFGIMKELKRILEIQLLPSLEASSDADVLIYSPAAFAGPHLGEYFSIPSFLLYDNVTLSELSEVPYQFLNEETSLPVLNWHLKLIPKVTFIAHAIKLGDLEFSWKSLPSGQIQIKAEIPIKKRTGSKVVKLFEQTITLANNPARDLGLLESLHYTWFVDICRMEVLKNSILILIELQVDDLIMKRIVLDVLTTIVHQVDATLQDTVQLYFFRIRKK